MILLTQKEAAGMLRVSVSYLRASDCPKVLLPSRGKRSLVRYRESEVLAWAEKWTAFDDPSPQGEIAVDYTLLAAFHELIQLTRRYITPGSDHTT